MDTKMLLGVILVTLGTSQSKVIHTEPMCTRFSYDELLLEKMIKIEHKTEVMIDNFKEISVEVRSNLESMTEEFEKIKNDAKALSAKGHDNIENIKSQLDEMLKGQEEKMTDIVLRETEKYKKEISEMAKTLLTETEQYKKDISDLKEQENRPSYAFSAYWLSEIDPTPPEELIFTRTLLDTDGVYNNRTGKFLVPQSGVYIFFSTLCSKGTKYAWVNFHTEERFIGKMFTGDGDNGWATCSSGSAIAHLQAGTHVFMRVIRAYSGNVFDNHRTNGINSFAGHLIELV